MEVQFIGACDHLGSTVCWPVITVEVQFIGPRSMWKYSLLARDHCGSTVYWPVITVEVQFVARDHCGSTVCGP